MDEVARKRATGLVELIRDAVVHGTSAVERVHRTNAALTFDVLAHVAPLKETSHVVRTVHDLIVFTPYATIRAITKGVASVARVAVAIAPNEVAAPAVEAR